MKNLVETFLSATDQERLETVVTAAEKKTAGEIVCMIVSSSYHYPMANVLGATAFALPLALLATHFLGGWLWIGTQNMWLFLGLFAIFFAVLHWIIGNCPTLKRLFISRREIDEEVEEAAVNGFFRKGLYRTRDANGVLLFISILEHKVWLLADKGIHEKISQDEWNRLVGRVTAGIRKGQGAEAICNAIEDIGDLLQTHFPIKPGDTNELTNLIIGDA
ncbi:MAG: TPM domain-containing protein [Deltaproteobacteria bacterium]|nr:TPM domain-containing protein [Deltaproteobacteria bacterium]